MKIILIPNCSDCPHGAAWNLEGTEYLCAKERKVNKDDRFIPKWCPLLNASDVLKKLKFKEK